MLLSLIILSSFICRRLPSARFVEVRDIRVFLRFLRCLLWNSAIPHHASFSQFVIRHSSFVIRHSIPHHSKHKHQHKRKNERTNHHHER
jgi:hypothetical protein